MRTAAPPPTASAPTQQLDPSLVNQLPNLSQATRPASGGASQRTLTVALVVAVLVIAALIITVFVMLSR